MASTSSPEQEELRSTDDVAADTMNGIEAQNDPLVASINIRLVELPPDVNQDSCIYKVPKRLRDVNEKCYTPSVVSIGPYTHGMEGLEFMEDVKLRYLQSFVEWSRMSIDDLVKFTREREARARACYEGLNNFDRDEFVGIILVDAAFVLTHLLNGREKFKIANLSHFGHGAISRSDSFYDLYLLENQLPLFFLEELFGAALSFNNRQHSFQDVLRELPLFDELELDDRTRRQGMQAIGIRTTEFYKGGLSSNNRRRSLQRVLRRFPQFIKIKKPNRTPWQGMPAIGIRHLVDLFREYHKPSDPRLSSQYILNKPKSLTALYEAGVKFKVSSSKKLLDIHYKDGLLKIPRIKIYDSTETVLRNIVAFEQCHGDILEASYVTDYIVTMSTLVKTPRDVELLSEHGILLNNIGDNTQVSNLFNNLGKNIYYSETNFYYAFLFEQLDEHSQISWKKWCASLKHDYFKNPWSIISVIAAATLLILTLIQTAFTIISVVRPS